MSFGLALDNEIVMIEVFTWPSNDPVFFRFLDQYFLRKTYLGAGSVKTGPEVWLEPLFVVHLPEETKENVSI